ncbi:MAG: peptidoglycan-binding domain-containing protein [Candidatus Omnitrophota bacterium]
MFVRLLVVIVVLSLAGCATSGKSAKDYQIQSLERKVEQLEGEVERANQDISSLRLDLQKQKEQKVIAVANPVVNKQETKSLISDKITLAPEDVQKALKNAGFYAGVIDGKLGAGTEKAIRDFQKANNLTQDGVVGAKTWLLLEKHLNKIAGSGNSISD